MFPALSTLYKAISPILFFTIPPEAAHRLTITLLKLGLIPRVSKKNNSVLETEFLGRKLPNPIGLAAGFDKDAEAVRQVLGLGFGHVEIGTVTPLPQPGNPKPRIFRHVSSYSIINRMGFPSKGMEAFKASFEKNLNSGKGRPDGMIGINIGMNKGQKNYIKDYSVLLETLGDIADYVTINISSPNTPGLRDIQSPENLAPLLDAVCKKRDKICKETSKKGGLPIFVKFAPDLDLEKQEAICNTLLDSKVDGIIVTNTTLERPVFLPDSLQGAAGGLSGKPLAEKSTEVIANFYRLTGGKFPIIGVGGVYSGEDAYKKIRAGASLVQLYTSFVYRGPYVANLVCKELYDCLQRDGFNSVQQAIGIDVDLV